MFHLFSLVYAAVTPPPEGLDSGSLQKIIGLLITVLLMVITFLLGKLWKSIDDLYSLNRRIGNDLAELKGEHEAMKNRVHP